MHNTKIIRTYHHLVNSQSFGTQFRVSGSKYIVTWIYRNKETSKEHTHTQTNIHTYMDTYLDPGTQRNQNKKNNHLFDFISLLKSSNINYKRSHRSSCLGQITMKQLQKKEIDRTEKCYYLTIITFMLFGWKEFSFLSSLIDCLSSCLVWNPVCDKYTHTCAHMQYTHVPKFHFYFYFFLCKFCWIFEHYNTNALQKMEDDQYYCLE